MSAIMAGFALKLVPAWQKIKAWGRLLLNPVGVAWTIAAGLAVALVVVIGPFGNGGDDPSPIRNSLSPPALPAETNQPDVGGQLQASLKKDPPAGDEPAQQPLGPSADKPKHSTAQTPPDESAPQPASAPVAAERAPVIAPRPEIRSLESVTSPKPSQETPQPVDVHAALQQPILRFEQSRPVPLGQLLRDVEEMAGVPLRFENPPETDGIWRRQVSLTMQRTTVGDILEALLHQAGLTYIIEEDGIRLRRAAPNEVHPTDEESQPTP